MPLTFTFHNVIKFFLLTMNHVLSSSFVFFSFLFQFFQVFHFAQLFCSNVHCFSYFSHFFVSFSPKLSDLRKDSDEICFFFLDSVFFHVKRHPRCRLSFHSIFHEAFCCWRFVLNADLSSIRIDSVQLKSIRAIFVYSRVLPVQLSSMLGCSSSACS